MPPIPEVIAHYQRSIEKCGDDQARLLHCLDKLYLLHVSVQHLKETGIGRTVNKLRKVSGAVGVRAKLVVNKWKAMVTADDTSGNSSMDDDDYMVHFDDMPANQAPEKHKPHRAPSSSAAAADSHDTDNGANDGIVLPSAASTSGLGHQRPAHSNHVHGNGDKSTASSSGSSNHHTKPSSSSHGESSKSTSSRDKSSSGVRVASSNHEQRSSSSQHHKSSRSSIAPNADPNDTVAVHKSTSSGGSRTHHPAHMQSDKPSTSSSASKRRAEGESPLPSVSAATKERKPHGAPIEKKSRTLAVEEIDSSMGTSFADALGMMAPSKKSSSASALAGVSAAKASSSKLSTSASRHAGGSSGPSTSRAAAVAQPADRRPMQAAATAKPPAAHKKSIEPPSLLSTAVKLAPLDPAIAVAISNDYRPMPLNPIIMDCVFKASPAPAAHMPKTMTDAELGASMSSKNQRTKVYSGVKSGALLNVPSLHEMCIRVLQRNIDALEATGGVPYDILKPVLDRANPEQLFTLEDYNPYLIEDTGDMWKWHCSRKFRGQVPRELETWRDMFMRCREEQETRLNNVTQIIKRTQTVAVPVKQTKITYVDSAVKPPRDVLKKQARFGTERATVCTPAARVASLNNTTSNIARPGDARLRVLAGTRDHAQVSARAPRKAPLMQKTLQHLKGLYKR